MAATWLKLTPKILLTIMVAVAILYVRLFVPGPGNGADFVDFYAGAYAEAHGLDAFDNTQLGQAQRVLFYPPRYTGAVEVYSYKNPPPFALLVRPFTGVNMSAAYWLWLALITPTLLAAAFLYLSDWPIGSRLAFSALVAICPAALWGLRVGQNSAFVALGFGLATYMYARGRPGLAGAALCIGFMKPHLAIGIGIVFLVMAAPGTRWAVARGIGGGCVLLITVTIIFDRGLVNIAHWIGRLHGDTTLFSVQSDIAAVPGLFYHALPSRFENLITVISLIAAGVAITYFARRTKRLGALSAMGGGLAACFAVLPYVHTSDQVVLALVLVRIIGPDGSGLRRWPTVVAAYVCVLAPLALFHSHQTPVFDVLPPVALVIAYALMPGSESTGTTGARVPVSRSAEAMRPGLVL